MCNGQIWSKKISLFKQRYTNMEKEDIYDLKRISQNSFGENKKIDILVNCTASLQKIGRNFENYIVIT